jgi:hypothetical protein
VLVNKIQTAKKKNFWYSGLGCCEMDERMCHIIAFVYRAFLTLGERNLVNQGIALSHTSESNVVVNKIQIAKKKKKKKNKEY